MNKEPLLPLGKRGSVLSRFFGPPVSQAQVNRRFDPILADPGGKSIFFFASFKNALVRLTSRARAMNRWVKGLTHGRKVF